MITIEQVKEDISSGKSKMVFYSSNTLWWTHLENDLKEASLTGRAAQQEKHKGMMADPAMSQEKKDKLSALNDAIKNSITPLDPSGSPLMQMDTPITWVTDAEGKPGHFGKHSLKAFMLTHHQNCNNVCHTKWDAVNEMINNT